MTIGVGQVGMGTSAGDVTAVSDVDDVTVMTCVGNVGMRTRGGDITAVADVNEVAVTIGVGGLGREIALVT